MSGPVFRSDSRLFSAFFSETSAIISSKAIYTEEPRLARDPSWQLILAAEFSRSVVICEKHHDVRLYRVERLLAL
jgi:hypothetical protein